LGFPFAPTLDGYYAGQLSLLVVGFGLFANAAIGEDADAKGAVSIG
jgi:hypothetical protein